MSEYLQKIFKLSLLSLLLTGWLQAGSPFYTGTDGCCDPCVAPCNNNSCCFAWDRLAVTAEGLYWRTTEDNTAFATENFFVDQTNFCDESSSSDCCDIETKTIDHFKKKELHFKWNTGFRLTLDYLLPCDKWDTSFTWTTFNNHAHGNATGNGVSIAPTCAVITSGSVVGETFLVDTNIGSFSQINAHWHLEYDNYEWDIGRNLFFCPCFYLHPYIGLKWERFRQKFNFVYNRPSDDNSSSTTLFGTSRQKFKTDFNGFGFQGGLDADWCIGCGVSLYSNVSGGIAYGKAKVHERINERSFAYEAIDSLNVTRRDSFHIARPNVDFALGLRWNYLVCNCYEVCLQVAWEYHHYFDQNFFKFAQKNDAARGDLTFQGLTFGGGVRF